MNKTRLLSLLLVIVLAFSLLASCGETEDPVVYQEIDLNDVVERTDYTSVYEKIGSQVTIDMVEENDDGIAFVTVNGVKYELGMDFLSMAMVYNCQVPENSAKYQDAEDAKAQLAKAAAKAAKAAAAAPENEKLAEAAAKAQKAADDAAAGVAIPETFKDYLDKWVYSVKDHQELLNKIGGARLVSLKNAPHLGYSNTHLK